MSWPIAARIARRELRGGLRGFRVFLACLALGVAAIAAVGSVRENILSGIQEQGATLLGGDAEIELTYRFATPDEAAWMAQNALEVSEIVDFRSMAVAGPPGSEDRALTQVKSVDDAYPLYGALQLEPAMSLGAALDGINDLPGAVLDPVLADRLGLVPGDTFRLGDQEFVLMARLLQEPDSSGGFSLGPRTIVRTQALESSGLLQPGTLFETAYRMKLPEGQNLDLLKAAAQTAIEGGGFRWRDSRNGAPGASRAVDRLGTFLILVGLAGLAVGGVGVSAAIRSYLEEKVSVIATLKALGAEGNTIFRVYSLQIGVLAVLGIAIGVVLGALLPVLLAPLIEQSLPLPISFGLRPVPLGEAALYGALSAALFALWPLAKTRNLRAATLFRDAALGVRGMPGPRFLLVSLLLLSALVGSAMFFTGQSRLVIAASAGLIAAFLTLTLASFGVRILARYLSRTRLMRRTGPLRHAFAAVGGPSSNSTATVLSLGLGLAVLAAIGQIDSNMRSAIAQDLPKVAPSFFVLDIQPDQLDGFLAQLQDNPAVTKVETAPMLRGVITRINGRPAKEVAGGHWVVSGDRGVTYAQTLPQGTELTAGAWWPRDYNGPPQISFAAEEAAEIGLKLGDTMTVNILGRDIEATITSFRNVDFSNAGMGFVLAMNPAALQGAPHTHIATIYADQNGEAAILRDLTTAYPNITAIGVREVIGRFSEVLRAIAAAITYGASATLLTGLVVLIGAAAAGERARTYEAAILKTLGATRANILANFSWRSVILGAAAGLVAILAGGLAGWAVITFVMDGTYRFEPFSALAIVAGGIVLTTIAGLGFSLKSLNARPAQILRGRE